jgi:Pyridoxamine 5'-phosphate oxidase
MSVAVDLEALGERLAEYGDLAYLLTVTDDQTPHAVSVRVALRDGHLVTSVGRRTGANLAQRPTATLLWPPTAPDGAYSLIVDGRAVTPAGEGPLSLQPTTAVLHRVAGAPGDGPTCIPVAG